MNGVRSEGGLVRRGGEGGGKGGTLAHTVVQKVAVVLEGGDPHDATHIIREMVGERLQEKGVIRKMFHDSC